MPAPFTLDGLTTKVKETLDFTKKDASSGDWGADGPPIPNMVSTTGALTSRVDPIYSRQPKALSDLEALTPGRATAAEAKASAALANKEIAARKATGFGIDGLPLDSKGRLATPTGPVSIATAESGAKRTAGIAAGKEAAASDPSSSKPAEAGGTSSSFAKLSDNMMEYLNDGDLIVGRPHNYTQLADPNGRVWLRHMLASQAPVVQVRPGRVIFAGAAKEIIEQAKTLQSQSPGSRAPGDRTFKDSDRFASGDDTAAIEALAKALEAKRFGTTDPADASFDAKTGRPSSKTRGDSSSKRYFGFEADPGLYMDIVAAMASRIYGRFKGGAWQPNTAANYSRNGGFFPFWADNATSVNESAANEAGASMLNEVMKTVREFSGEVGYATRSSAVGTAGDIISALNFGDQTQTGVLSSMSSALNGSQPLFPEYWRDSNFGRDYNISFKFVSPYGDVASIYQNVLLPFCMVLGFSLPVLTGPNSYASPMICQFDCPGYFSCDMGIVTSLSFVKGGSEGLWAASGLPRAIEVTMTVKDLYPTLTASATLTSLNYNIGLTSFLDNLAGIDLVHSGDKASLLDQLKVAATDVLTSPTRYYETGKSKIQGWMQNKVGNLFGGSGQSGQSLRPRVTVIK